MRIVGVGVDVGVDVWIDVAVDVASRRDASLAVVSTLILFNYLLIIIYYLLNYNQIITEI